MSFKERSGALKPILKTPVLLGLFFGMGFLCGFFVCFGYVGHLKTDAPNTVSSGRIPNASFPRAASPDFEMTRGGTSGDASFDVSLQADGNIDLALEDDWMDSDENGLYITGMVKNISPHSFDAVRIAYDLCDAKGDPYTVVTDTSAEHMEPGDTWGFTIYIPYSDMDQFSSYRLQSIMGITK
ncbi:MAG: FxLYD domain-containing protein [Synergistaceae bacterium]|jgi:hypothetical protein|nr:FxLYD domain-containing protein [Synergistaceae bacterium]